MRSVGKYIVLAAMVLSAAGISISAQSFAGGRSTASRRSVEDQIFRKLISLPNYGVFDHIAYQLNGSTVVLSGNVWSLGTKKAAENAVKRVPGVDQVVNNIRNLPPSAFDNQIRYRILREFQRSPGLYGYLREPNPSVRIIVDGGRVSLEGYVANRSVANTMNILANGVFGVFSVRNNLVVESDRVR